MNLSEAYKLIKKSIVAFVQKYPSPKDKAFHVFPHIIGTGFIVNEGGLIATNDHVIKAFKKIFKPSNISDDDWGINTLLLYPYESGILEIPLEVISVSIIRNFDPGDICYCPKAPDFGIVQVKAKGLPKIEIDHETIIEEGTEVATSGFPMGTDALIAPGWLHQITPTLQRGIISAVLPFPCSAPHAFTINIMTQGGASGSPVFLPQSGKLIGILYAGLKDIAQTYNKQELYSVPTNISYVIPAYFIVDMLEKLHKNSKINIPEDAMTLDQIINEAEIINRFKKKENLKKGKSININQMKRKFELLDHKQFEE